MSRTPAGRTDRGLAEQTEEMIQAIVDEFDRTFSSMERPEALGQVKRLLQGLDESTLRALAYRQGVFEPEPGSGKPGDEEC